MTTDGCRLSDFRAPVERTTGLAALESQAARSRSGQPASVSSTIRRYSFWMLARIR
jgi:hypothetical protein